MDPIEASKDILDQFDVKITVDFAASQFGNVAGRVKDLDEKKTCVSK